MESNRYVASAETISVIVPVYKVEEYLPACIDSILAQTHRDFQLILVDDGSPDRSGEICDEYAAKDSRIVVIHQENGGVSAARNAGLDWVFSNSESRWINWVDSDDLVSPVYLETLYRHAVTNDADITATGGFYFTADEDLNRTSDEIISVTSMTGRQCCHDYFNGDHFFMTVVWGKLFRREMFRTVRFPVGRVHEDEAVAPILFYNAKKVVIVQSRLYGYRQREGSIMRESFSRKRFDLVVAQDEHIKYFQSRNDAEFTRLAVKRRDATWASHILHAHNHHVVDQIPEQYRMPMWKVYYITLIDTMRRGGVKLVLERVGNLFEKIIGKR